MLWTNNFVSGISDLFHCNNSSSYTKVDKFNNSENQKFVVPYIIYFFDKKFEMVL